ncbi:outer membrane protein [Candidatus Kinetoplastibacterium crithidii (ex Angomonas deanei ATCC 30255)]|nr:OmpH family outer membrane protein [Candidatus Kinetoplastibacterium crithidii]AFZ82733.1 outer membrane protein [Candidatus Kinetoplastibacterium crithidii (ex Angomonas deanei ATCC 30255)]
MKRINFKFVSFIKFILIFLLSFSFSLYAHDLRVGFVSTERILKDSDIGRSAQSKIESEFTTMKHDLHNLELELRSLVSKFEKDGPILSENDKLKKQRDMEDLDLDLQRKRRAFQEDFNRRRNEEFSIIISKANECIKKLAEEENYDLIIEDAVVVNPRIDITDKIIKNLNG